MTILVWRSVHARSTHTDIMRLESFRHASTMIGIYRLSLRSMGLGAAVALSTFTSPPPKARRAQVAWPAPSWSLGGCYRPACLLDPASGGAYRRRVRPELT